MKVKEGFAIFADICIMLMNAVGWLGVYAFNEFYQYHKIKYTMGFLWIFVYFVLFFLIWHFLKNRILRIAGLVSLYIPLVAYMILAVPLLVEKAIFFLIMITVWTMHIHGLWKQSQKHLTYKVMWYYFAEVIVIYAYGIHGDEREVSIFAFFLAIGLILLHFWNLYVANLAVYFAKKDGMEGISSGLIFGLNSVIVLGVLLVMYLGMFVTLLCKDNSVLLGLTDSMVWLVQAFAGVILSAFSWIKGINMPVEDKTVSLGMPSSDSSEMVELQNGDGNLAPVIAVILGVAVCILCMYLIVRKMKRIMGKHLQSGDEVEEIAVPEELATKPHVFQRVYKQLWHSDAEKVRRHFKRRVRQSLHKTVHKSETAQDLCRRVNEKDDDDISELTYWYEVARYGNEKMDKKKIKRRLNDKK